LNGIGRTTIPARNLFIGAIVNGFINYQLTAMPSFGIRGAAIGTTVGFAIAALLNLLSVKKHTGFKIQFSEMVFKPLIAVLGMALVVKEGFPFLSRNLANYWPEYSYQLSTFGIVIIAAFAYLLLLLLTGEIKYNDLVLIPVFGKKLANLLLKIGLVGD